MHMKRILIVGAGGQIGSELTVYLRKIYGDHNVVATDMRECKALGEAGPFEVLNALDATAMASVVARYHIDTIFNLVALLSAVGERNPQMAWNVNMGALNNSLEVARQHHCALFTPSSIGAFGPSSPKDKTPQDTIMQPTTIYGICKVTGEMLGNYYHHKYGVDTRSVRFPGIISNVTLPGGGTTDYAVEIYYEAIRSGRFTCPVPSDVYMDMIYMPDALRACVELMEADPARTPQQFQHRVDELHAGDYLRRNPKADARLHDGLRRRPREEGDRRELAQLARRYLRPRGVGVETRMGSLAHDGRYAGAYPCQSRREVNPGDDGVAISRVVETAASWDGAPLPSYPRGAPRVTILRATVPPHTALAMHTHALVNAGVILRGELTVIAETGAQRMFRAGEGIVELVGTRHYGENRGDGELELVMFYAGTQGMSLSERADL